MVKYVKVDDIKLCYDIYGDGEPLVLVEGLGYAMWMWFRQIPYLSKHLKLIVYDNRGVGCSDKPNIPYTMDMFASDLRSLLDELGISEANILGVSMGGMIAQTFALKYPKRTKSLILVSTHHGGKDVKPASSDVIKAMFGEPPPNLKTPREILRYKMSFALTEEWIKGNNDVLEQMISWRLENPQPQEAYLNQAYAVFHFDLSDLVDKITAPTTIVHGEKDKVVPVENALSLYRKIPRSRLIVFRNASHLLFIERYKEFNDIVLEHINLVKRGTFLKEQRII